MNKYILYIRISLLMLLMLPFVFFPMEVLSTNGFFLMCFYFLNLILWILFFLERIKNKNYLNIKFYDLLTIIASIYFLILLGHGFYDTYIIIKNMYAMMYLDGKFITYDPSLIGNNIAIFITLHIGFIMYDVFLLIKQKGNNSF